MQLVILTMAERKRVKDADSTDVNLKKNHAMIFETFARSEGNGNPLQYSCLENSMDGGAW